MCYLTIQFLHMNLSEANGLSVPCELGRALLCTADSGLDKSDRNMGNATALLMSCMYFCYCLVVLLAPPHSWGLLVLWPSDWKQHLYIQPALGAKTASHASPAWLVSLGAEPMPSSEVLGSYSSLLCFSCCCASFSHASSALCVCTACKRGQNTACCIFLFDIYYSDLWNYSSLLFS